MNSRLFISIVSFLMMISSFTSNAQQMTVATYNLRYDNPRDTGNLWVDRMPIVASLIRFHGFDIFGTQEGLKNQLEDLKRSMPEFTYEGIGRDDGISKGEHSAIFFKKDQFELKGTGNFWLSTTPDKPGPGWDAHLNRICTWVLLKPKSGGKDFYVFNAHYDHQGVEARKESSKLILAKIKSIAGASPVIFMGDLNGGHDSEWYTLMATSGIMRDAYTLVENKYVNNGSFNGWGSRVTEPDIIDHIFVSKDFKPVSYGILTDTYKGKYPSDHFPVVTQIKVKREK